MVVYFHKDKFILITIKHLINIVRRLYMKAIIRNKVLTKNQEMIKNIEKGVSIDYDKLVSPKDGQI